MWNHLPPIAQTENLGFSLDFFLSPNPFPTHQHVLMTLKKTFQVQPLPPVLCALRFHATLPSPQLGHSSPLGAFLLPCRSCCFGPVSAIHSPAANGLIFCKYKLDNDILLLKNKNKTKATWDFSLNLDPIPFWPRNF